MSGADQRRVIVSTTDEGPFTHSEAIAGRSPCPMVNSLANHGYLPRDGLNISMEQLVAGFTAGVNLAADATELVGRQALKASTTGRNDTFDLDDLSRHGCKLLHVLPAGNGIQGLRLMQPMQSLSTMAA